MNQKQFIVSPYKLIVALTTAIIFLALAVAVLTIGRYGSAAVFFLISVIFFAVSYHNGSTVRLLEEGVELAFFNHRRAFIPWSEIREVGVAGTKVLRQKNRDDVGSVEIYFSRREMSDEERRNMLFQWPPRVCDIIYMAYIQERLIAVQMAYNGQIVFYNNGKAHF